MVTTLHNNQDTEEQIAFGTFNDSIFKMVNNRKNKKIELLVFHWFTHNFQTRHDFSKLNTVY